MSGLRISTHAIERYQERVCNVSEALARQALSSPTIVKAAEFGCGCVKLPGGQRVVIEDHCVVTVIPRPSVCRRRYGRPERNEE